MNIPTITPITEWYCPACGKEDQTRIAGPHQRMHICPKTRFMTVPFVRKGINAKIVLHEREEYVGQEDVQLFEGRPVMSMETVRDEGTDLRVYAPTATAKLS